jgi:hypothetical protein
MHWILRRHLYGATFLFFLLLITLAIVTGYTFLGVQDELQLQATLKAGDVFNYMTSYPLALIVGALYSQFPSVQWYSVMVTLYLVMIMAIMSFYIVKIELASDLETRLLRVTLFVLALLFLLYNLLQVNVTTLTLGLVVVAVPLIRMNIIAFWVVLFAASLLREQIIFSILPLVVIVYLLNIDATHLKKRQLLWSAVLLFGVLFNHFSYYLHSDYRNWMEFTQKRAHYTDFGGATNHDNLLTYEEYQLAKSWWILDHDLYPVDKISYAAGSMVDIVKKRIETQYIIKKLFRKYPLLYGLFALSLVVAWMMRSWVRLGGYLLFGVGVVTLLLVKDVERVSLPLFLLWLMMLFVDVWHRYQRGRGVVLGGVMLGIVMASIVLLFDRLPLAKIDQYEQKEALHQELKGLIKRNQMNLEITSGYPSSWGKLIEALMQNHLFEESHWVGYDRELLLSGWLTNAPLPYQQHEISFGGVERKYPNFHAWLMDEKSGIVGSKGEGHHIQPFLARNLMRLYDEKFPKKGCNHAPIVVDESQHFIIHRIVQRCTPIEPIEEFDRSNHTVLWSLHEAIREDNATMYYTAGALIAHHPDPRVVLMLQEPLADPYLILDVEIDAPKATSLQLFYREDLSHPFSHHHAFGVGVPKGQSHITIKIPTHYIHQGVRIDPVGGRGVYRLDMRLYRPNLGARGKGNDAIEKVEEEAIESHAK